MEKLDPKTDGATMDIVGQNMEKLKELFPDVFTEGKVDFDALRETLGDYIDDREEQYSFSWNGKSRARRIAQTPSTGTLRPCPEESVNWDTTQNLFIEGDNLEVLKLLQKSYHKRVKMIYIDPPYNTGNEFIYPDKFADNLETYLRYTGQIDDEGFKISANADTSGRYHTNWLNMMLPRLKLARNLLSDDGVIFISIDDNEVSNLKKICDEVFGEENFLGTVARATGQTTGQDSGGLGSSFDFILVFAKNGDVDLSGLPLTSKDKKRFNNEDERGLYAYDQMRKTGSNDRREDRPNMFYPVEAPDGTAILPIAPAGYEGCWRFERKTYNGLLADNYILWKKTKRGDSEIWWPYVKYYLEGRTKRPSPLWTDLEGNKKAARDLRDLFDGKKVFDFPKSVEMLKRCIQISPNAHEDALVLDFFAGSSALAHAVLDLNKEDAGNRRFIMAQLPEPCDEKSEAYSNGHKTIAEIGKERIRRVIKKIEAEQAEKDEAAKGKRSEMTVETSELDLGFKVFKLDASNIKPWDGDFDNLEIALFDAVENIKPDRTEADVLYELLLKYGLGLTVPIEDREISGKIVYIIGAGALIVCLAKEIGLDVVEGIAALKEELKPEVMRVVFRDAGFKDDVVKTNAVQILRQAGIEDVKSL